MDDPIISMQGVNHYYGSGVLRRQILFDISAEILAGEIVIVNGPSGSGKTTLLTLVGGLRSVEEGSLRILGQEMRGAAKDALVRIRASIGFIFQAHNLLEALTARQNVQMAMGLDEQLSPTEACARSEAALRAVGLADYIETFPAKLSGGQRQRVAIARALVRHPKIVLADEPTAALDRKTGREVVELLHQLAKEEGCAILMVTHDNRILDLADRVLTLEDGRMTSFVAGLAAHTGQLLSALATLQRKGDLLRHMTELSDRQFLDVLDRMTGEFEQFLHTLDLGNQEAVRALFDQVLEAVMRKIRDLLHADRATLFLVDRERGQLHSKIAHGNGDRPLEIRISLESGIAGYVARTGATLNISDPYSHPDFNPAVDRETGYHTRNVLCMPVFDRQRNVFAVAQLLNKVGEPAFPAADEERFREFADPLGAILESCLRMTQLHTPLGGLAGKAA